MEKFFAHDPYEKGCQKMTFEIISKVTPLVTSFTGLKKKRGDIFDVKEELRKEFLNLEEGMTNQKAASFGGDFLCVIDYLMWSWFQPLEALELNECVAHTPKLKLWVAAMQANPIVSSLSWFVKSLPVTLGSAGQESSVSDVFLYCYE